ncbi:MAG: hypothetical protein AB2A00_18685 [Myxococcota bacterium]
MVACAAEVNSAIYERRIEPLVTGGQPNSCNQCHLSGVDLSMFVRETPCNSMACLQYMGMVNFANPAASPILNMIRMAQPDSPLITQDVINAEHQGFLEWIRFSASCQAEVCGQIADPCSTGADAGPPTNVITPLGSCSESSLASSFYAKVYDFRDRCTACHAMPHADVVDAPAFFEKEDTLEASLRSMYNVIGLGAVDVVNPAESTLLTKPLQGVVEHGGGDKFHDTGDVTYQSFLSWIVEYSACRVPDGGVLLDAGRPDATTVDASAPRDAGAPRDAATGGG